MCPHGAHPQAIGTAACMTDPDRLSTVLIGPRHRGQQRGPGQAARATSSSASHVGWCWDGIACEARKQRVPPATPQGIKIRTAVIPEPGHRQSFEVSPP